MSEYQAIYDAVRSKISNGDVGYAIERVASNAFDISHSQAMIRDAFMGAISSYDRPSAVYRPRLFLDGNMYCALYGEDLMNGCAGFGETADAAMRDFDQNWVKQKAPTPHVVAKHKCGLCGDVFDCGVEVDGCRDPDCPMQARSS